MWDNVKSLNFIFLLKTEHDLMFYKYKLMQLCSWFNTEGNMKVCEFLFLP